ncbi:formate dehydrogenase accessory sulfurtransferase FdhD [Pseudomonas sp. F1_0610]|uniref:formate dehydrogenase accessory sulfurtransferase FdhD n=1 Tax=Pseudomonas sp. F1_0610 TaxID=3114284 RepID=UPI0039C393BD
MSGYICLEITPSDLLQERRYTYYQLTNQSFQDASCLAQEMPLSITFNGINHSVMMLTPQDIGDFTVGFSLSYQIIQHPSDILDMQLNVLGDALEVEVTLNNRAFWQLKSTKRELAGSTGCGLCGVSALEQALPQLTPLTVSDLPNAQYLQGLRERIQPYQVLAEKSGALHAALFFDAQGEVVLCREDIGRHNALDKLIGALYRQKIACDQGFVVMTSRSSLELLQKTVRAGIHTLVSLSAPSSLTVDWARKHNLNLIHVPHQSPARVYSPQ